MDAAQALNGFHAVLEEILEGTNFGTVRELRYQLNILISEYELPLQDLLAVCDRVTSGEP